MDIITYDNIYRDMVIFNNNIENNYGNVVRKGETTNTVYPYTIIEEVRNIADRRYNTMFDKVSSMGYRITIMAKTKGNVLGQDIARQLARHFDNYMTNYVGLLQTSFFPYKDGDDNSIYVIQMLYTGNLHQNRRKFL